MKNGKKRGVVLSLVIAVIMMLTTACGSIGNDMSEKNGNNNEKMAHENVITKNTTSDSKSETYYDELVTSDYNVQEKNERSEYTEEQEQLIRKAEAAFSSGDYETAYKSYKKLATQITSFAELMEESGNRWIEQEINTATELANKGRIQEAINELYDILIEMDYPPVIVQLKESLEAKLPISLAEIQPFAESYTFRIWDDFWINLDKIAVPYHRYTSGSIQDNTNTSYDNGIIFGQESDDKKIYKTGGGNSVIIDYYIEKKYDKFTGVFACTSETRLSEMEGKLKIYCDERLVYETTTKKAGVLPESFSVDVSGITMLRIEYSSRKFERDMSGFKLEREAFGLFNPTLSVV